EAARDPLEVPDVRDGGRELDVPHPVATDLAAGDLDPAALADDPLEPNPLVLAAVALPVPGGTEDTLAEEPVLLRLQGPVVDRLGLLHLAVRPGTDLVRRRQPDPDLVEVVDVQHLGARLLALALPPQVQCSVIPGRLAQSKSAPAGSRLDRSIPSSSAARNTSSSVS